MRSSLLLAHHSSPFISVISTANEHCTTGVQAFPPSHASVWLKVRFYLFAFYSRRAFLYSTTTSHPRAKPLRTCHLYQTEAMCALTRSMCVGNCSPHAALHSFSPERRKEKKKRNQAWHSPSSASPCQAVPVVHRDPSKAAGGGHGSALPQVLRTSPVAAFPYQGPGGASACGGSPGSMQLPCCGVWSGTWGCDGSAGVLAGSPVATASATGPCGCLAAYSQEMCPYFTQRQRTGENLPSEQSHF